MINGAHIVIYTKDPEADRAFFRDMLKFSSVDAGHGWLIFAMPPLEAAFHDSDKNDQCELYLRCDDIAAALEDLRSKTRRTLGRQLCEGLGGERTALGKTCYLHLPGGGEIGIYQPKHPSPLNLNS